MFKNIKKGHCKKFQKCLTVIYFLMLRRLKISKQFKHSKMKLEVMDIDRLNKEKMLFIDNLTLEIENTDEIFRENYCNSCNDTYAIQED